MQVGRKKGCIMNLAENLSTGEGEMIKDFKVPAVVLQLVQFVLFLTSLFDIYLVATGGAGKENIPVYVQGTAMNFPTLLLHLGALLFVAITVFLGITGGWRSAFHFLSWIGRR